MANFLFSDMAKVTRGSAHVLKALICGQIKEINHLANVLNARSASQCVSSCLEGFAKTNPKTVLNYSCERMSLLSKQSLIFADELRNPNASSACKNAKSCPNFSPQMRNFNTSAYLSSDDLKHESPRAPGSQRSLGKSKQRRVPATRIGRMAGFGSK